MTKKRPSRGYTFENLLLVEDVHKIVKALGKSPTGLRNATLIVVLWRTGLRIDEALNLKVSNIDMEGRWVHVHHGKNDVTRDVPADRQTIERVQHWLDVRKPIVGAKTTFVFCTRGAKKMDQRYARRMMTEAGKQAGIAKPVHPHAFRHLYAGELQREGLAIATIARLLGHASTKTTAEYLERCFPDEIRDSIRSRPEWG